ncbi:MAG: class I adenylate-forming enzyme family protein, partial [Pseudomonadota bacterium]
MQTFFNIALLLEQPDDANKVADNSAAIALIDRTGDRKKLISYDELRQRVAFARAALYSIHEVKPGDRVALLGDNSVSFLSAYFAVMGLGATAVPINPNFEAATLTQLLNSLEPALALIGNTVEPPDDVLTGVTDAKLDDMDAPNKFVAAPIVAEPIAPAVILYTSGSTGMPKG